MKPTHGVALILAVLIAPSFAEEENARDWLSPSFDWMLYYENCVQVSSPHGCDMPEVGYRALELASGDAYRAVELLLPAATAGEPSAQVSISKVMQMWLQGFLRGESEEQFTWRESWVWMQLAASTNEGIAREYAGRYLAPRQGLPEQRPEFPDCLTSLDRRATTDDIRACFAEYGGPSGSVWP